MKCGLHYTKMAAEGTQTTVLEIPALAYIFVIFIDTHFSLWWINSCIRTEFELIWTASFVHLQSI